MSHMMHVMLEKGPFLKALTHQQSMVEKKTTVPVLSQVMLAAQGEKYSQMGTLLGRDWASA